MIRYSVKNGYYIPMIRKNPKTHLYPLVLLLLLATGTSHAGWEFYGWYGGGLYSSVVFDPHQKNRLFLASDVNGVWLSNDAGSHWQAINQGLDNLKVASLSAHPKRKGEWYAATENGLFRTVNAGKRWQACGQPETGLRFIRPDNYQVVAISAANDYLISAGRNGRIYLSTDNCQNWQTIPLPLTVAKTNPVISKLQWHPYEQGFYIALGNQFYFYSLVSAQWQLQYTAKNNISDFVIYPDEQKPALQMLLAGGSQLVHSADGGNHWQLIDNNISQGHFYRLSIEPENPDHIVAILKKTHWRSHIIISHNGGSYWKKIDNFQFDDINNPTRSWKNDIQRFIALSRDPFNHKHLFVTSGWGVLGSDDGGFHWREKILGSANSVGSDIHISHSGVLYAATMDNGLLRRPLEGKTFIPAYPPAGKSYQPKGHVWRVLSKKNKPEHVIATLSPWNERTNYVLVSKDGGKSFIHSNKGLPKKRPQRNTVWHEGFARALAIAASANNIIYLGIDGDEGGLFVSTNSGYSWQPVPQQPPSRRIYNALAVSPHDANHVYWGTVGQQGGLYFSPDGGRHWQSIDTGLSDIFDLLLSQQGMLLVAGKCQNRACINISRDNGKNWQKPLILAPAGTAEALWIHPDNQRQIMVSIVQWGGKSGGKILQSFDAGKSFHDISDNLPAGSGIAAMAYDSREHFLYVIRYVGSVYRRKLDNTP